MCDEERLLRETETNSCLKFSNRVRGLEEEDTVFKVCTKLVWLHFCQVVAETGCDIADSFPQEIRRSRARVFQKFSELSLVLGCIGPIYTIYSRVWKW